ncbi:hypothetical protein CEXT_781931 [Caerostris extrusa]|uniref:Uncharacterized protein n=1 Tax=Caerostris extrusa TaxID=172846 RepID=A0AAV4S1P2_CAEEX|nr:hypothetical protein CEXT_781931 [Caerostris extrusa]
MASAQHRHRGCHRVARHPSRPATSCGVAHHQQSRHRSPPLIAASYPCGHIILSGFCVHIFLFMRLCWYLLQKIKPYCATLKRLQRLARQWPALEFVGKIFIYSELQILLSAKM